MSTGSRLPKELPKQFLGPAGAFLAEADRFVFVFWITNQTTHAGDSARPNRDLSKLWDMIGQTISHYRIVGKLGASGNG